MPTTPTFPCYIYVVNNPGNTCSFHRKIPITLVKIRSFSVYAMRPENKWQIERSRFYLHRGISRRRSWSRKWVIAINREHSRWGRAERRATKYERRSGRWVPLRRKLGLNEAPRGELDLYPRLGRCTYALYVTGISTRSSGVSNFRAWRCTLCCSKFTLAIWPSRRVRMDANASRYAGRFTVFIIRLLFPDRIALRCSLFDRSGRASPFFDIVNKKWSRRNNGNYKTGR